MHTILHPAAAVRGKKRYPLGWDRLAQKMRLRPGRVGNSVLRLTSFFLASVPSSPVYLARDNALLLVVLMTPEICFSNDPGGFGRTSLPCAFERDLDDVWRDCIPSGCTRLVEPQ